MFYCNGFRGISLGILLVILLMVIITQPRWLQRLLYPIHHEEIIFSSADKFGVDPYLITAVIRVESKFFPRALSSVGARGLMQIMPETGRWAAREMELADFTPDQLFEPEINILIGAWYLASLQREFADLRMVLAAYNSGGGNVKRWLETQEAMGLIPDMKNFPFAETRHYVSRVLNNYRRYREIYQIKAN
ncbi:MAG: lytic transglycosylase domain-containing protein [Firmicutes bacterium]|nr:lytic transglycosylase domain-containing protein [Bacillota bacterium]